MGDPASLRVKLAALCALIVVAAAIVLVAGRQSSRPTLTQRVKSVASQLRCPVCQGESVWDAPSGLAQSMRSVIRRQLTHGRSQAQVQRFFVRRYGQWILLAPPVAGIGALIWVLPPILLLLGMGLVATAIIAWRKRRGSVAVLDDDFGDRSHFSNDDQSAAERPTMPGSSRRVLQQTVLLIGLAGVIAVTAALAIQQRGTAAITGTVPGAQSAATIPNVKIPSDVRRAAAMVGRHPKAPAAWSGLGSVLLVHHRYSAARQAFRRAIDLRPLDLPARLGLAFVEIGRQHGPAAITVLRPVLRTFPGSPRAWMLQGLALGGEPGGADSAIHAFEKYIKLAEKSPLVTQVRTWIVDLRQGRRIP